MTNTPPPLVAEQGSRARGLFSLSSQDLQTDSAVMAHGLSCSATCGITPVSPTLADRFFCTEPPRKALFLFYFFKVSFFVVVVWLYHEAHGILVPQPWMNPCLLYWERGVLTTGPSAKGVPTSGFQNTNPNS